MSTTIESRNPAATAASNFLKGHIPEKELNACIETIKEGSPSYPVHSGSVTCVIFYWRIVLNTVNNKQFTGNSGGIGSIGGAATFGDIYLAEGVTFEELISSTATFQFTSAAVYLNVNFFNSDSKYLGGYHGGGVGTCLGTGGGIGSWS